MRSRALLSVNFKKKKSMILTDTQVLEGGKKRGGCLLTKKKRGRGG
jgi:hypothetical protein